MESANGEDVKGFLTRLATVERVGAATQKQALNALVFFLKEVEGKGDQDRVTVLAEALVERVEAHRERLRRRHAEDRAKGLPGVWLPEGLERKWPEAGKDWAWQWMWPSRELMKDPRTGLRRRGVLRPDVRPGSVLLRRGVGCRLRG